MCKKSKSVGQEQTNAEAAMAWSDKILSPLATAGIVFLFCDSNFGQSKDLHDRFLKLLGGNLNIGTDALDEAANRIGTYLRDAIDGECHLWHSDGIGVVAYWCACCNHVDGSCGCDAFCALCSAHRFQQNFSNYP